MFHDDQSNPDESIGYRFTGYAYPRIHHGVNLLLVLQEFYSKREVDTTHPGTECVFQNMSCRYETLPDSLKALAERGEVKHCDAALVRCLMRPGRTRTIRIDPLD